MDNLGKYIFAYVSAAQSRETVNRTISVRETYARKFLKFTAGQKVKLLKAIQR